MATQVNVGTVGTPIAGAAPQPTNLAQSVDFTAGADSLAQVGTVGAVDVGVDGVAVGTISPSSTFTNGALYHGVTDAVAAIIDSFTVFWDDGQGGNPQQRQLTGRTSPTSTTSPSWSTRSMRSTAPVPRKACRRGSTSTATCRSPRRSSPT